MQKIRLGCDLLVVFTIGTRVRTRTALGTALGNWYLVLLEVLLPGNTLITRYLVPGYHLPVPS